MSSLPGGFSVGILLRIDWSSSINTSTESSFWTLAGARLLKEEEVICKLPVSAAYVTALDLTAAGSGGAKPPEIPESIRSGLRRKHHGLYHRSYRVVLEDGIVMGLASLIVVGCYQMGGVRSELRGFEAWEIYDLARQNGTAAIDLLHFTFTLFHSFTLSL